MTSLCLFFFFKQKTAYEMRISDWSSDVCSSDLQGTFGESLNMASIWKLPVIFFCENNGYAVTTSVAKSHGQHDIARRSEEHTSELQSLMRISYAVFCLKKKKQNQHNRIHKNTHTHN